MAKQIRDIKDAQKFMNTREEILAEINMIKALVWKLWEESHGSIEKSEWKSMKEEVIRKMRK
jgi:hypothetical protein